MRPLKHLADRSSLVARWYYRPGVESIPIDALVSPLRLDVLVRAEFLEALGRLVARHGSDIDAIVHAATGHPYHAWYQHTAFRTENRRWAHDRVAGFTDRVARAIELLDSFSDRGFDPGSPIEIHAPARVLPTVTGKVVTQRYFVGDGCHRLALLILAGHSELPPAFHRLRPTASHRPLDNTHRLLRDVRLSETSYVQFIARGYGLGAPSTEEHLRRAMASTPTARRDEITRVLAVDRALLWRDGGRGRPPGQSPADHPDGVPRGAPPTLTS